MLPNVGSKTRSIKAGYNKKPSIGLSFALRRSGRTSLKRRLRWSEKNPDFGAFEQPEPLAGPPCVQNRDVPAPKANAEPQPQPSKRVKGEEAAPADEGWATNHSKHLSFNNWLPAVSSKGVVISEECQWLFFALGLSIFTKISIMVNWKHRTLNSLVVCLSI